MANTYKLGIMCQLQAEGRNLACHLLPLGALNFLKGPMKVGGSGVGSDERALTPFPMACMSLPLLEAAEVGA